MTKRVTSRWNRLSIGAMAAGFVSLAAAAVLLVLSVAGIVGRDAYQGPEPAPTILPPRQVVQLPRPTPTAAPTPPSDAAIASLAIPAFDIEAPIVVLGVDGNGVMETPDGPTNVAWYDFSARPGFPVGLGGGNAVFSGHVDYYNYGPAVFWHLKDLEAGDEIQVRLADGTRYTYAVVSRQNVDAATAPVDEIVGDTPNEVVTLITCGGTFNPGVGEYDQRVIVRAERIYEDAPAAAESPARR